MGKAFGNYLNLITSYFNSFAAFTTLVAADIAYYIIMSDTSAWANTTKIVCGFCFGHVYTIFSFFTLLNKTLPSNDVF